MSRGQLSDYFRGVAFKKLSAVEANVLVSNQHEYNGTNALKKVFGPEPRPNLKTRFVFLEDGSAATVEDGYLTWYDARAKHPTRSEYRLYFPTNEVTSRAKTGDALFIAMRTNGEAFVIVSPAGSTTANQLLWLFGIDEQQGFEFAAREFGEKPVETGFAARLILDEIGIEAEGPAEERLDGLIERFGLEFPSTREFSAFARSTLPELSPADDPDDVLVRWLEREEQLFRRLERRIVAKRLPEGFSEGGEVDVDGFLGFSLSVQNRRKARAGAALENHLEVLMAALGLKFERGAETENRNRPDFLFPGAAAYHNPLFPPDHLFMLGAKTTCKDRWRQVLSEAERIANKHLLTLEPGISRMQTDEMKSKRLQLVLPAAIHATYGSEQRSQLATLRDFCAMVGDVQRCQGS